MSWFRGNTRKNSPCLPEFKPFYSTLLPDCKWHTPPPVHFLTLPWSQAHGGLPKIPNLHVLWWKCHSPEAKTKYSPCPQQPPSSQPVPYYLFSNAKSLKWSFNINVCWVVWSKHFSENVLVNAPTLPKVMLSVKAILNPSLCFLYWNAVTAYAGFRRRNTWGYVAAQSWV